MQTAYHTTTTVLPGNRIEVTAPELKEGQEVQVIVVAKPEAASPAPPREFGIDIIESLNGYRYFQSVEEVDRYINEERDSWER
jgi:hypothetical protein